MRWENLTLGQIQHLQVNHDLHNLETWSLVVQTSLTRTSAFFEGASSGLLALCRPQLVMPWLLPLLNLHEIFITFIRFIHKHHGIDLFVVSGYQIAFFAILITILGNWYIVCCNVIKYVRVISKTSMPFEDKKSIDFKTVTLLFFFSVLQPFYTIIARATSLSLLWRERNLEICVHLAATPKPIKYNHVYTSRI